MKTQSLQCQPFHFIQGASSEIELVKGKSIRVTPNIEFAEKCSAETLYVDYKNIAKVVQVDSKVYVDDGLISLIVKSIGNYV
jgi:pyruvate kinase